MKLKLVKCDDCKKPLFYADSERRTSVDVIAKMAGHKMNGYILCDECKGKRSMLTADKEAIPKIIESDYRCGNCEVIDWCGKVPFSDLAICKNSVVNKLTATEYIEIAKEVDTSELEKSMNENDFEDEDEYDDHLMQLICTEVEKKVCMPTADNEKGADNV